MPTMTDRAMSDDITSWDQESPATFFQLRNRSGIATESQPQESPEWPKSIDALLALLYDSTSLSEPLPNRAAISAALAWLSALRKQFPGEPPTCITTEPSGGIIFERRELEKDGHEYLAEYTFCNDGTAEYTLYRDRRVELMLPIPHRPSEQIA